MFSTFLTTDETESHTSGASGNIFTVRSVSSFLFSIFLSSFSCAQTKIFKDFVMAGEQRDALVKLAKICQQAGRYEDMAKIMKQLVKLGDELSSEENNMFSVAYKGVVETKRSILRDTRRSSTAAAPFSAEPTKSEDNNKTEEEKQSLSPDSRTKAVNDLNDICNEVLKLLEGELIPKASETETKAFYLKTKADYYRYMAEVAFDDSRDGIVKLAEQADDEATKEATELDSTNPIRLGLALNVSVFHYEITDKPDQACDVAKKAYNEAFSDLDMMPEEDIYEDITDLMELLRENLSLWTDDDEQTKRKDIVTIIVDK